MPSRHRRDSCPSDEVAGGFFSDFEAVRRSAQVDELYKAADDLNVFEWARIDKGDDDLALETLVSTPLAQSKPDAFQATAAFVRGITAVVARRKESATMIPEAMGYLLKKLQTKTNKHTGCKQCPVCKCLSGNQMSGAPRHRRDIT